MVIVRLMGGLGNQMQQYALYLKLISLGRDAYIDVDWFDEANQIDMAAPRQLELSMFQNVDYRVASSEQIYSLIADSTTRGKIIKRLADGLSVHKRVRFLGVKGKSYYLEDKMYNPVLLEDDDLYLEGFWAAEKYYSDIWPEIRDKFSFDISTMSDENRDMAQIISGYDTTCSLHVRRGDYLDPVNMEIFGNIATEEYYDSAIEYIESCNPQVQFVVFSDDVDYVREKYGERDNFTFVDINHGLDSRYDIYLMSLCDMHICANSTFSFWGARLATREGTKIRPTIQKNSQVFEPELMKELWKGWTFIDPKGVIM